MTISSTTDIAAPPEQVWDLISDVRHWPELLPHTVSSVTPLEADRPEEVGARYVIEQPKLARATWEITEWAPPNQFTWRSHTAGVTTTGTHVVEAANASAVQGLVPRWTSRERWAGMSW